MCSVRSQTVRFFFGQYYYAYFLCINGRTCESRVVPFRLYGEGSTRTGQQNTIQYYVQTIIYIHGSIRVLSLNFVLLWEGTTCAGKAMYTRGSACIIIFKKDNSPCMVVITYYFYVYVKRKVPFRGYSW